ncbi:FG-GAP-like repeat-containing protein [Hymenobacter sediminicola]|uniref:T9SS type A sorting domain-containing protein n=1 Tax=Hymenobacter sediminicola TaxID=2761579 RepID=A0A7G7W264_9BACT|nr:FG-GAP-like repeat-containing protein [Hymenobacter sediminicola]QNH60457.1 T9SS type A sorting domain-containing protein [Hymenobacter sediminicola]
MLIASYPNLRAVILCSLLLSSGTAYSQGFNFSPATYYSRGFSGSAPRRIVAKDINADGRADIFLSVAAAPRLSNQYLTFLQSVNGGFAAPVSWPIPGSSGNAGHIEIVDVTGDSKPDVVVGGGAVTLYTNLGNSNFSTGTSITTSGTSELSRTLAVGDFNGDGHTDLATNGVSTPGGSTTMKLLYNNGSGQFTTQPLTLSGYYIESIAVGRLNTDSRPDLSVVGLYGGNCSTYLNTNTTGTSNNFAAVPGINPSGAVGSNGYLADVDGDQLDDFLSPHGSNVIFLHRSIGNGQFGGVEQLPYPDGLNSPRRLTTADFDNDGNLDLVASGNSAVLLYRNLGNANFAAPVSIAMPAAVIDLASGDVDGNGKLDLVVLLNSANPIAVLLNQTALSTQKPTLLSSLALYPNPASEKVNIELSDAVFPVQVKLVNMLGQTVATHTIQSNNQRFPVEKLSSGAYRAVITDAKNHQTVRPLQIR